MITRQHRDGPQIGDHECDGGDGNGDGRSLVRREG